MGRYRVTFDAFDEAGEFIEERAVTVEAHSATHALLVAESRLDDQHPGDDHVGGYAEQETTS